MVDSRTDIRQRPSGPRRRVAGTSRFALRFPARLIPRLAAANEDDDREAFAAGRRSRDDFAVIVEWKTRGRSRSRPARNRDAEIADALDLATARAPSGPPWRS
jgi:hypothetical protein